MFRERVFSSIGIVLVLGLGMYVGGLVWVALITLLVWGALKEYADMLMPQGYKVPLPLLMLLAVFMAALQSYMMIAWTLSFLVCLEAMGEGWRFTLLAFLIVWATDAGAYCTGMLFGRHKMAPVISPKKSWEGAVGGVLCCLLAVIVYNSLVLDTFGGFGLLYFWANWRFVGVLAEALGWG